MFDFNNFHILQEPYETQGAKNLAGLAGTGFVGNDGSFQIKVNKLKLLIAELVG